MSTVEIVQDGAVLMVDSLDSRVPPASPAPTLADLQAQKLVELSAACATQITSGYQSSALGPLYTYPSKITDQINMMGSVTDSLIPNLHAAWSTPFWCADSTGAWSYHMHTAAQIQQAGRDGKTAIATAQTKLALLNTEVMAATTQADLNKISWGSA